MDRSVPGPMTPGPFRVLGRRSETADTFTLELEPVDGAGAVPFAPGQFNMLYVFGVGEVPISISGDPARPERLVHTTRAVGPVTRAMGELKRGHELGVRGPFGTHWPVLEAVGNDVVVVAGGIGLAPLRPAVYHVLEHRDEYGRVALLYGARTPADILYVRELEQWRARFDLEVEVTVDRATGTWRGSVGVVTNLIPRTTFDPSRTVSMICGPEVMMRFTILELQKRGVSSENIYVSIERNMKCGIGQCGRCQLGPWFVCKDGPVFRYEDVRVLLGKREV